MFSVLKQGGDLKILFGDSAPQETERNLAYFNLLLNQQLDTIDEFKAAVLRLDANRVQLAAAQEAQEKDRASLTKTRAKLVDQRWNKALIDKLSASLARDGKQVAALRADSVRLNTLLAELLERLANLRSKANMMISPHSKASYERRLMALARLVSARNENAVI